MLGVDLNQYRNIPSYPQLAKDGYEFAIIKLATGVTFTNPLFEKQYNGCKDAGLILGVYTRAAATAGDGAEEARYALNILGDRDVDLPIYYDVEGDTLKASKGTLTQMVLDFGKVMTEAGHRWGLYTSRAHFKYFDLDAIIAAGASIWCAAYNNVGPGMDCDIWQRSSSGTITGYDGPVDVDVLYNNDIIKKVNKMGYTNSSLVDYTLISPNRTSPRENKIDTITIHCFVGQVGVERGCQVFQPTSKYASCNYVVAYDGKIGLVVEEKDRSWCSSSPANDARAVTIEVASDSEHPYAVTDAAYKALINLVTDICKRNGIKKLVWSTNKNQRVNHLNGCNMTVHRDYANKSCPGQYLYERHGEIAAEVNKRLGVEPEAPKELTADDMPTISQGSQGDAVVKAQELLAKNGYPCSNGGADGIFGAGTRNAVIKFQKAKGLDADGVIGPKTWKALFAILDQPKTETSTDYPTIKMGDTGKYVKLAQQRLFAKGYSIGSTGADGIFGSATKKAVREFQKANGLAPDGIIGPKTWAKLV